VGEQHGWRAIHPPLPPVQHGAAEPLEFETGLHPWVQPRDGVAERIERRPVGGVDVVAGDGGDPQQLAEPGERGLV
jgi:hypothetical protein